MTALLLLAMPRAARAQTQASADLLRKWVTAAREHVPGQADASAGVVAGWSYGDRARLHPSMELFLAMVRGEGVPNKTDPQRQIIDLFQSVRGGTGLVTFLKRAAVLHTDAAIFRDRFPAPVDDAPAQPRSRITTDARGNISGSKVLDPPPLFTNDRFVLHTDGRVVGESAAEWNWPFARSLLDLVLPRAEHRPLKGPCQGAQCLGTLATVGVGTDADRPFIAEWYHAVDSYLLAIANHGDLKPHLAHAAEVFPDDAHLLFDRACYAETLGLPAYQVLPGDSGNWKANGLLVDLPSEEKTDEEAERLFRRVIEVDPSYAEARVRLARLLERRKQNDAAAAEIEQAFALTSDTDTTFYAHLVAGRVAQARGRFSESLEHYVSATTLFPDAQSALVGASQSAVMAADIPKALSFVQRLSPRSEVFEADPWWIYQLGSGRDVNELMAALWAHAAKL